MAVGIRQRAIKLDILLGRLKYRISALIHYPNARHRNEHSFGIRQDKQPVAEFEFHGQVWVRRKWWIRSKNLSPEHYHRKMKNTQPPLPPRI
jgi:hypothetical protein